MRVTGLCTPQGSELGWPGGELAYESSVSLLRAPRVKDQPCSSAAGTFSCHAWDWGMQAPGEWDARQPANVFYS